MKENKEMKSRTILKKFFEYFKKFSIFLVCFQIALIIIFVIFYYSSQLNHKYPFKTLLFKFNDSQKKATGLDINLFDDYVKALFIGLKVNIFGNKLETINLFIDKKNFEIIEQQRLIKNQKAPPNPEIIKKLSRATLVASDNKYDVKVRLKGARKIHYYDKNKLSYKIDIIGKKRLYGMEEFNLQKPIIRNYTHEYIFHKLQRELGNISIEYLFKNLTINGKKKGLYVLEEGMSKELIERYNHRYGPIFNADDRTSEIFPTHLFEAHSEKYWKKKNIDLLNYAYSIINSFREQNFNYEDSFDWKKWARYFAVTDLLASYHGSLSKSVNFYYNPATAKFEPIGYDAHVGAGQFDNFVIFDFLGDNPKCIYLCRNQSWYLKFFYKNKNELREDFVRSYFSTLKEITSDKFLNNFFEKYDDEINLINESIYGDFSKVDKITWVGLAPFVFDKDKIYQRAALIRSKIKNFDNFKITQDYQSQHDYKLNVINKTVFFDSHTSNVPIKVKFTCSNDINRELLLVGRVSHKFKTCKPNKKNIIFYDLAGNKLTKNLEKDNDIQSYYKPIIFRKLQNIKDIIKIDKNFNVISEEIHIKKNTYIPKNQTLFFNRKNKIYFYNNAILFSEGNLNFEGTKDSPILIKGNLEKNGSIVQIGGKFFSKNLTVENLDKPSIKQSILFSGLNIINSEVLINNTKILNSNSEDAINIIHSDSYVKKLSIENSLSDGLDIDGGKLDFEKIDCNNINNDCLDISGTNIKGNYLKVYNAGDKAFSAGENSRGYINEIDVKNSEIGLAVKDSSFITVKNLNLYNVKLAGAIFNKKKEFGSSELIITNIDKNYDFKNFLVGKNNKLQIYKDNFEGDIKNSVVEKKLYGNEFGAKTVR